MDRRTLSSALPADADRVISAYLAAWNEPDALRRLRLLRYAWHDDGVLDNPLGRVQGIAAMNAYIGSCLAARAGCTFDVEQAIVHSRRVHLSWALLDDAGRVLLAGHDCGELAVDGRIRRLVGYFAPADRRVVTTMHGGRAGA